MPQSYTTQDGQILINPGTYVSVSVQPNQGNTATAGVVTIIGEADEGPGFLDEANLDAVAYSPTQYGQVLQKYGSGRIVDAFKSVISAANDPNILGGVSLVRIVKTNQSQKGAGSILGETSEAFANLLARKAGLPSNLIKYKSSILQAETAPTTGLFSYVPATSTSSFSLRINGGTLKSVSVAAKTAGFSALIEDVNLGIMCKGAALKQVVPSAGITLTASATTSEILTVSLPTGQTWANSPAIGDTALIPAAGDYSAVSDSVIAGAATANTGTYIVQSVTNTVTSATLVLKKIHTNGALVSASGSASADLKDLLLISQAEIKNISGDRRLSTVGITGTYQTTQNDGANVIVQVPSFANQPKAGDYVKIPSAFIGIQPGFYQVTASTSTTMNMTRLSDGSSGSGTASTSVVVAPTEATESIIVLAPTVKGLGKTLSIEGDIDAIAKKVDGSNANLSNQQKVSQSELKNQMDYAKGTATETFKSGGDIVLLVGCSEDNAKMDIMSDKIEFSVDGTLRFSASFKQFKTLSDLAAYISSQTNFSASITSAKYGAVAPSSLDKGSFDVSGLASHKNGRIKKDAADFQAQNAGSALVTIEMVDDSGLPEAMDSQKFLSGGSKGGTTSALAATAIDATEKLFTNFIVPLFSVDATEDIANGETESSSTYTIDSINAYLKSHVLKMSAIKMRKNRVAIASKKASYADCKEAASELNSFRMYLCFQDIRTTNSFGEITVFQPWMAAINAAGMQAAAGYKGIVKKFSNVSGIQLDLNDFDSSNPGDTEDALKAGLLFMERVATGGFRWFSDQSTYTIDNNFVYNSLQAVYISDLIVFSLIDTFDRLVVGKSVAEVSAAAALSILEAEMFNFKRLRWITESDDAIKGYKNATVTITGPVLEIACEIKLAGLIYFVPISLSISEVQQTA